MKRLLKVVAICVAVLLIVAVAAPFLVDANRFRPLLESTLSEALGREVTLGGLRLSLLSGSLKADDLAIADDAAFSKSPFIRAKSLGIAIKVMPLILSRTVNVTGVTILDPEVDLIQDADGRWNFSSLGAKPGTSSSASAGTPSPVATNLSVDSMKISGGRFTLAKAPATSKPIILDKVNLQITNFEPSASFPFSLAANLTGDGVLKLEGKAGPFLPGDAAATPFSAKLQVTHLDVVLSGLLDASLGIGGLLSIEGSANSNNSIVAVQGKLKAEKLKLVKGGAPAKPTAELDLALTHDLKKQSGTVSRADIHLGKDLATLTGSYNFQPSIPAVKLKLSGHALAVTELAAFLPALAVVLPAGASLDQGTVALDASAEGPLDNLVATGRVDMENARLANYDFASKMKVLDALAGIKAEPHTVIQTFSANIHTGAEGADIQELNLIVPSVGDITGAGSISREQALDFKMRVALHASMASMAALGSKGGIPFTVGGTSSDPSFKPDMKGLVTDKLKDVTGGGKAVAGAAGSLINGLFGKKKPQQ